MAATRGGCGRSTQRCTRSGLHCVGRRERTPAEGPPEECAGGEQRDCIYRGISPLECAGLTSKTEAFFSLDIASIQSANGATGITITGLLDGSDRPADAISCAAH